MCTLIGTEHKCESINFQSKASFKINLIAVASVAENDAFTTPTPTLTGDPS
jgi:hypothetical protein